jgi:hypothetical protein
MIKTKTIFLVIVTASLTWTNLAQAQESMNSSGGDAIGSGGSVAYSLGQVVYTSNTGTNGSVGQGVQHAFEIFTAGNYETMLNISLTAFPNPTTGNLILEINDLNMDKLSFQLVDMQGKQITKEQVIAEKTTINMFGLPASTYFINLVNQENTTIQSFKILKNQ